MLTRDYLLTMLEDIREKLCIFPQRAAEYAAQEAILVRMLRATGPRECGESRAGDHGCISNERDALAGALEQELSALMDTPLGPEVRFIQRVEEWKAQGFCVVPVDDSDRDTAAIAPGGTQVQLTLPLFGDVDVVITPEAAPVEGRVPGHDDKATSCPGLVKALAIAAGKGSGQVQSSMARAGIPEQERKILLGRARLLVLLYEEMHKEIK
ncbi:MAG TPA: hypothetical protein GXX51_10410 [Firmicutes bacterium]|nr:hypothetical protein [Bacillota bacterium]